MNAIGGTASEREGQTRATRSRKNQRKPNAMPAAQVDASHAAIGGRTHLVAGDSHRAVGLYPAQILKRAA